MSDPELRTIAIRGFPLDIFEVSRKHSEALLREFAFIAEGGGDNAVLPKRLLDIVDYVRARASGLNVEAERVVEGAIARGDVAVDFDLVVPERMAQGAPDFSVLLDEVDEYCRAGDLLTLATPPEVRAFRSWYVGEIGRQIQGHEPTPWTGTPPG